MVRYGLRTAVGRNDSAQGGAPDDLSALDRSRILNGFLPPMPPQTIAQGLAPQWTGHERRAFAVAFAAEGGLAARTEEFPEHPGRPPETGLGGGYRSRLRIVLRLEDSMPATNRLPSELRRMGEDQGALGYGTGSFEALLRSSCLGIAVRFLNVV